MQDYKNILIELALIAGEEIMRYYGKTYNTEFKKDSSPVTDADIAANDIIVKELVKTKLPIISEESVNLPYEERAKLKEYWLVDPLDGTKQFVRHEKEFTVNIARIVDNLPVEGVVYAPVFKKLYYGNMIDGAFLYDYNLKETSINKLPLKSEKGLSVVVSKSHLNEATKEFVEKLSKKSPNLRLCKVGSSLKFCCLAEGHSDIYPRIGAISEWDIAAGHAIIKASGGCVINLKTAKEVTYNKESLRTPDFTAFLDKSKVKNVFHWE